MSQKVTKKKPVPAPSGPAAGKKPDRRQRVDLEVLTALLVFSQQDLFPFLTTIRNTIQYAKRCGSTRCDAYKTLVRLEEMVSAESGSR